uniref:chemotaxis protein CheA n=1 Tax=Pseudomonas sp. RL TaxID=1452718 RepID=UPI0031B81325
AAPASSPAAPAASGERAARRDEQSMIKVDARKLDQLIDAVGELVTRSARCRTLSLTSARETVETFVEEVDGFIEQLRDRALKLRMAPINEVFQRFPRVVRDVARDLGKEVELQIRGAETELDKTMLDKLADPLLHIVRNALDHGIEPVEARRAAGKPARGRLLLNAYHESGSVVLEISDDGRGLNAAKIRARAIERGLIGAETLLDEQGIFALIFEAGFSTAEQVTDLSGRGVGMDVVRRSIEALRGSIEIQSTMGQGTCFRIRLPLTLSIIDGFQVVVGEARFVIPLEQVVECLELPKNASANQVMSLRGTPLSYLRLAELFELPRDPAARECLVVVQHGQQRTGIVVDRFAGELQAVIKPLNPMLRNVPGLGGSTILGDGRVALILDINSLLATPRRVEHA